MPDVIQTSDAPVPQCAGNRYRFLDTFVNALSLRETVEAIEGIIADGGPCQHVVINASKINLMDDDPDLLAIVNACPIINADGASIVWAAKKLDIPLEERVTGIDLFLALVEVAARKDYGIYLFGAREEVVGVVKEKLTDQYPDLRIVGSRNGYFSAAEEMEVVEDVSNSNADMLFVAFSSPKKEYWINRHLDELNVPFVMGVGGSFDVVAGVTSRAPKWLQRMGLEWFYRFIQEPKRLFKRYFIGNYRFVRRVMRASKAKGRDA